MGGRHVRRGATDGRGRAGRSAAAGGRRRRGAGGRRRRPRAAVLPRAGRDLGASPQRLQLPQLAAVHVRIPRPGGAPRGGERLAIQSRGVAVPGGVRHPQPGAARFDPDQHPRGPQFLMDAPAGDSAGRPAGRPPLLGPGGSAAGARGEHVRRPAVPKRGAVVRRRQPRRGGRGPGRRHGRRLQSVSVPARQARVDGLHDGSPVRSGVVLRAVPVPAGLPVPRLLRDAPARPSARGSAPAAAGPGLLGPRIPGALDPHPGGRVRGGGGAPPQHRRTVQPGGQPLRRPAHPQPRHPVRHPPLRAVRGVLGPALPPTAGNHGVPGHPNRPRPSHGCVPRRGGNGRGAPISVPGPECTWTA